MPDSPEKYVRHDQNLFEQRPYNYLNLVSEARNLELRRSWRLLRGANLTPEPGRETLKINTRRIKQNKSE